MILLVKRLSEHKRERLHNLCSLCKLRFNGMVTRGIGACHATLISRGGPVRIADPDTYLNLIQNINSYKDRKIGDRYAGLVFKLQQTTHLYYFFKLNLSYLYITLVACPHRPHRLRFCDTNCAKVSPNLLARFL
jgi:hypothetical protein